MAAARSHMIATLDTFRDTLEDLGGELGVTDPQYARFSRLPSANNPLTLSRQLSHAEHKAAADLPAARLSASGKRQPVAIGPLTGG